MSDVVEGTLKDVSGGLWLDCEPWPSDPRHSDRCVSLVPQEWCGSQVRVVREQGQKSEWVLIERVKA